MTGGEVHDGGRTVGAVSENLMADEGKGMNDDMTEPRYLEVPPSLALPSTYYVSSRRATAPRAVCPLLAIHDTLRQPVARLFFASLSTLPSTSIAFATRWL